VGVLPWPSTWPPMTTSSAPQSHFIAVSPNRYAHERA
jgi:hypothetical protein